MTICAFRLYPEAVLLQLPLPCPVSCLAVSRRSYALGGRFKQQVNILPAQQHN